jgi:hypothetical protein
MFALCLHLWSDGSHPSLFSPTASVIGSIALVASGVQLVACKRRRGVLVEVTAGADTRDQRPQVIRSNGPIDDLTLAALRFGGGQAHDRRNPSVEIKVDPLAGSQKKSLPPPQFLCLLHWMCSLCYQRLVC